VFLSRPAFPVFLSRPAFPCSQGGTAGSASAPDSDSWPSARARPGSDVWTAGAIRPARRRAHAAECTRPTRRGLMFGPDTATLPTLPAAGRAASDADPAGGLRRTRMATTGIMAAAGGSAWPGPARSGPGWSHCRCQYVRRAGLVRVRVLGPRKRSPPSCHGHGRYGIGWSANAEGLPWAQPARIWLSGCVLPPGWTGGQPGENFSPLFLCCWNIAKAQA
jgi:hypothetical protein